MNTMLKVLLAALQLIAFVNSSSEEVFENWHFSLDVGGPVSKIFRPQNNVTEISPLVQSQDFAGGLFSLMNILAQVEVGKRIRAYGSKWSTSNAAYVSDYLVESGGLTFCKVGIDKPEHITLEYQPIKDRLVFAQSGIFIKHLGSLLLEHGYSLSTMGTSDGQRLAGLISTGTHASAPRFGSTQEFVRGIHLVISKSEHVFIQRATKPVITSLFASEYLFGTRLIEDDDLFAAAVVSIGSFGLIHAYVIEVEPAFAVHSNVKFMKYDDAKGVISSMDVTNLGFDGVTGVPWYLQIYINPYNLDQVYVGVYDKVLQVQSSILAASSANNNAVEFQEFEDDLYPLQLAQSSQLRFVNRWLPTFSNAKGNYFKRIIYSSILQITINSAAKSNLQKSGQPFSKFFTSKTSDAPTQGFPVSSSEIEIAVPLEYIMAVVDIFVDITRRFPTLQRINVRYVKGSQATLAFTRFNMTATVSLFGAWDDIIARDTDEIHNKITTAIASTSIPHCWHWGKKQPRTSDWVVSHCLGLEVKNAWIKQREALLNTTEMLHMFSNDNLESLGLYTPK